MVHLTSVETQIQKGVTSFGPRVSPPVIDAVTRRGQRSQTSA